MSCDVVQILKLCHVIDIYTIYTHGKYQMIYVSISHFTDQNSKTYSGL